MSTKLRPLKNARILAVIAVPLWLVACVAVWDKSATSGGDHREVAVKIAIETAMASKLKTSCIVLGASLAEASIKTRLTEYRPSSRIMKSKESTALENWIDEKCPDKALVGLSYGVSKVVNTELSERRRKKTRSSW